ncbi:hypothetical protein [Actinomadura macrotermitis]|uniref:Uncharacterized protein n=1 Tax=Actinomadura macrotermitis TaxID=2585200 RepID=A0A7K0BT41_9ACTN|nr:hypothetical protein [Actinomadura macrotermitis]MQY04317.1 hypothetical protein [Actinomadura macrotermitis]
MRGTGGPRSAPDPWAAPPGPVPGARDTSGVQVRIGSRSDRHRVRKQEQGGRRTGLIAAAATAVVVAAGAVGGLLFLPGSGEGGDAAVQPARTAAEAEGPEPRTGKPVEVGTADGSRYRIAAVGGGTDDGVSPQQAAPSPGMKLAYVEYVLGNPTRQKVLLDYPGDVFVKRALIPANARGRCMWQTGVPEDMCTPPTKSEVVRRLTGGALQDGDGGDKYLPPKSSFLVRATVEVPVDKRLKRGDLRLYIWKKLYVEDQYAREASFPR